MGAWIVGAFIHDVFFWLWTSLPFFLVQYGRTERWLVGRHRVVVFGFSGGGEGGIEGTSGQHPAADGCCFAQSPLIERK